MPVQRCTARLVLAWTSMVCLGPALAAAADETAAVFVGAQSCSSSSCHGGAATNRNEFLVWSQYDFHHARPVATLQGARSARMAEALHLGDPAQEPRCVACHAPLQTVPAQSRSSEAQITEGVSCENCHGPARAWLRSHTRADWTHVDRVAAGMRDLRNLYVRANTCVACHQNVDPLLRRAGHPELCFEMDGQSASQPRHWSRAGDTPGSQAWLVGQAVALREMTWQLVRETSPEPNLRERAEGLLWVLTRVAPLQANAPRVPGDARLLSPASLPRIRQWSDDFAKAVAQGGWTDEMSRRLLEELSSAQPALAGKDVSSPAQGRRAERLVLALDRLLLDAKGRAADSGLNETLNRMYDLVQSLPDFDGSKFAVALKEFHSRLSDVSP